MNKLIYIIFLLIVINTQPIFAQNQKLQLRTSLTFNSMHFLGLQNGLRFSDKAISKVNLSYSSNTASSKLALNYDRKNRYTLDGSYLQYTSGIATYGLGSVDRHWSFSNKSSLILSHNARPLETIYLKLKNNFSYNRLPSKASWSFEAFNGYSEGSLDNAKSMLMGLRVVISPTERLDFELVQTSQWGGKDYSNGISALGATLLFDTNIGSNANINKMAGFGISYLIPNNLIPLRIYSQAVGEDEAGNLPSCYAYLAGLEWSNTKIKHPTTLGIEFIDTRINETTHGNCGPNTMYNNSIYNYTNYGKTLGAAIDSEGKSLEIFGHSQISQETEIKFSSKVVTINDSNWLNHRLSSKRQSGLISSLGVSWVKNSYHINANIYYQDFFLDNAKIKDSYGIGLNSSVEF